MSGAITIPVPMLGSKGSGGVLAAGVVALLIVLALASRRDPTAAPTANSTPFRV
jgi:hypothetical protein